MLQHEQLLWPKLFLHCNYRKATLRWGQLTTSNNFLRQAPKSKSHQKKVRSKLTRRRLRQSQSFEFWLSRNKVIWKTGNYRVNMHFHKEDISVLLELKLKEFCDHTEWRSKRWWIAMIVPVSSSFLLRENLQKHYFIFPGLGLCTLMIIVWNGQHTRSGNVLEVWYNALIWECNH